MTIWTDKADEVEDLVAWIPASQDFLDWVKTHRFDVGLISWEDLRLIVDDLT